MEEHVDFEKNKKSTTWIWVLVGIVILCLVCAVLLAVLGGVYFFSRGASNVGIPPVATRAPTPAHQVAPSPIPYIAPTPTDRAPPPAEALVEPIDPANLPVGADTLFNLTPGWASQTTPGDNSWQTYFPYDQPILIFTGWCTADQTTLEQNFAHITFTLELDGQDVPVQGLFWADEPGNGGYCRSYYGLVSAWPVGNHTVIQTMHFDASINDGWNDFPAGDYTDTFEITATP